MPTFMIERRYAEQLEVSAEGAAEINRINDDEGVQGPPSPTCPTMPRT